VRWGGVVASGVWHSGDGDDRREGDDGVRRGGDGGTLENFGGLTK
jgi:hypothetical protein